MNSCKFSVIKPFLYSIPRESANSFSNSSFNSVNLTMSLTFLIKNSCLGFSAIQFAL